MHKWHITTSIVNEQKKVTTGEHGETFSLNDKLYCVHLELNPKYASNSNRERRENLEIKENCLYFLLLTLTSQSFLNEHAQNRKNFKSCKNEKI